MNVESNSFDFTQRVIHVIIFAVKICFGFGAL